MTEPGPRRIAYLDGVRGVAAQIVIIFHFILGFGAHHRKLEAIFNGYTAVLIFFVLSGFVMSASSTKAEISLSLRFVTRYLRLALPMLPVALVGWLLLAIFPSASRELAEVTQSAWSASKYNMGLPPIWQAATDALIKPFVGGSIYLNSSTGTMRPELVGSILVFIIIRYCRSFWRLAILLAVGLSCVAIWGEWDFERDALFCFSAGSLIWHFRKEIARLPDWAGIAAAAFCLPLLVLTGYGVSLPVGSAYSIEPNNIVKLFFVAILIASIVASQSLQTIFDRPFPIFLGRISFGAYLVHQPLESTLFAKLYMLWLPQGVELLVLLVAFMLVSAIVGWALTLWVDEPVTRALKEWSRRSRLVHSRLVSPRPS